MAWLPLLFIGTLLFWTVALGLGGWSFMLVNDMETDPIGPPPLPSATAIEPKPGADMAGSTGGAIAIPVQVEESQESEDVNDNAGAVHAPEGDPL